MNDNAKKWVAALRSGEYRQGRGALRSGDEYCCLGVACDLYSKETGVSWESEAETTFVYLGQNAVLPQEVKNWLGLCNDSGRCPAKYQPGSLIHWNDGGWTFEEIADWIESEPEGLFETLES